jgi:hypothetical protein
MLKSGPEARQSMVEEMNFLGKIREPFIFIIDYNLENYLIKPIREIGGLLSISMA